MLAAQMICRQDSGNTGPSGIPSLSPHDTTFQNWFFYEPMELIADAVEREKFIKEKSRKWKEDLINATNPEWCDLTEEIMQRYR